MNCSTTFTASIDCPCCHAIYTCTVTVSARVRKTYTERGLRYDVEDLVYDYIEHDGGEVAAWLVEKLPKLERDRLDEKAETALVEARAERRTA